MQSYDHLKKEHKDHLRFLVEKYLNLFSSPKSVISINGCEFIVFDAIHNVFSRYTSMEVKDEKHVALDIDHLYFTVLKEFSRRNRLCEKIWDFVEHSYDLRLEH
jgi:hypothetical protein